MLSLSDTGEVGDPGDALNAPLWEPKDLEPTRGVSLLQRFTHPRLKMIQSRGGGVNTKTLDHHGITWSCYMVLYGDSDAY